MTIIPCAPLHKISPFSNLIFTIDFLVNFFLIANFEKEAYATGLLFYYNNEMNASLPFIEIGEVGNKNYTFAGDFKGYPLQRNDLTNSLSANRSKETFTYEEF